MTISRGKFITIEGGEGVGKSTNIAFVRAFLEQRGIEFVMTREPGGTPVAERIRDLLLQDLEEDIDGLAELLLVFAARAQHIAKVIEPALSAGVWVVCDRFTDATYAYQGGGRGLDMNSIAQLESLVQKDLQPDLTLILDMEPARGLERARQRGKLDRFEKQHIEFFTAVRQVYLARAQAYRSRCVVIDAGADLVLVKTDVLKAITRLFEQQ